MNFAGRRKLPWMSKRQGLILTNVLWSDFRCVGKEKAAYIPILHRYLDAPSQIPLEKIQKALNPVFEDEKIRKVGHNIKFDLLILKRHGFRLKNIYFDTMVASYCLDPARRSHGLKDLAHEFWVES